MSVAIIIAASPPDNNSRWSTSFETDASFGRMPFDCPLIETFNLKGFINPEALGNRPLEVSSIFKRKHSPGFHSRYRRERQRSRMRATPGTSSYSPFSRVLQ